MAWVVERQLARARRARRRELWRESVGRGARASRTLSPRRLKVANAAERELSARLPTAEEYDRPRTRADCLGDGVNAQRPCPWVRCRFHLFLDVIPETGAIQLNYPDLDDPSMMTESCALDVADRGGVTLDEVGVVMRIVRERARQLEVRGLLKLKMASPSPDEVGAALLRRPST